ncbi:MAG: sigma-70 family RNA polymerase sigma factor [Oscillospiraceae bacterium]|nr:sigma-70 family RNA polymerase sigma factor [Oscillospiraceae bacterium]
MDKEKYDKLIAEAAKTIFSYCRARTNSKEDAEDLSQEIILKLLIKQENLRDDRAFYGFMWTIAGNVCKEWYKKRAKNIEFELDENISDDDTPLVELLEKESDLKLLYRELGLLTEQYRKVVVMYYFDDLKVSDISKSLNISESMVKFLLFKSRKILKEGMNMERTKGDLSFNPVNLSIGVMGATSAEDSQSIWNLVNDNLIAQNILFACYNDRCTAEEISLQIEVAVPYLEKDLKKLCEKELLIKKGGKYETNIVIFTKEFFQESNEKRLPMQRELAEIIGRFINERLDEIKSFGFCRGIEDDNMLKWLIAYTAFLPPSQESAENRKAKEQKKADFPYPRGGGIKKYAGIEAIIYGEEHYPNSGGGLTTLSRSNTNGDKIMFADFSVNAEADCSYFDSYPNRVNIVFDIARGKKTGFSENDMVEIAEFIKRRFIKKDGDNLNLNFPVLTNEQYDKIKNMLDDIRDDVCRNLDEADKIAISTLVQHTPVSIKKDAENIGWVNARNLVVGVVKIMLDNSILRRATDNEHPTMFVLLA